MRSTADTSGSRSCLKLRYFERKMCRLIAVFLIAFVLTVSMAQPLSKRAILGCVTNKCSMLLSVLRDPRMIPNWKADRWDKAMAHMKAYTALFSNNDDDDSHLMNRRSARQQRLRARKPQFEVATVNV
ncbi:hypothetical protein M3Y98_00337000 [Aphelenchoides besseyi]|nr:hypothetical protein M3Y98_00337000 [Aphelenchoides besseyi]KAI6201567.1 hypothetical protein M3Y96_00856100 [Aphelenchoides besseyi]